jgi:hypothetical protein
MSIMLTISIITMLIAIGLLEFGHRVIKLDRDFTRISQKIIAGYAFVAFLILIGTILHSFICQLIK